MEWCILIGNDFTGTKVFPRNTFSPLPDMTPLRREIAEVDDYDHDDDDDEEEEDEDDKEEGLDVLDEEVRIDSHS